MVILMPQWNGTNLRGYNFRTSFSFARFRVSKQPRFFPFVVFFLHEFSSNLGFCQNTFNFNLRNNNCVIKLI